MLIGSHFTHFDIDIETFDVIIENLTLLSSLEVSRGWVPEITYELE